MHGKHVTCMASMHINCILHSNTKTQNCKHKIDLCELQPLNSDLRVEVRLLTVTHQVCEILQASPDVHSIGGAELKESIPEEAREHLRLVQCCGRTGDLTLVASVGDELDGELEHEAVGVLLGELVEEFPPCGVLYHLFKPGWSLGCVVVRSGRGGEGIIVEPPLMDSLSLSL